MWYFFLVEVHRQQLALAEKLKKHRQAKMSKLRQKQEKEKDMFMKTADKIVNSGDFVEVTIPSIYYIEILVRATNFCLTSETSHHGTRTNKLATHPLLRKLSIIICKYCITG